MAFEFAEPQDDIGGLGSVGIRVGQINFVISDGLVGLVFAPGDFAEAVGDRGQVGEGLLQLAIVGARGVQFVTVEIRKRAVEARVGVVRLDGEHARQGVNGIVVGVKLDANVAFGEKPGRIVGRRLQFVLNQRRREGGQTTHYKGLHGGGQQIVVVRVAGDFQFKQPDALREVGFLEIGASGQNVEFGGIGIREREFLGLRERVVEHFQRAVRQPAEKINLREPQPRAQIIRNELAYAGERDDSLANQMVIPCQQDAVCETKTRFVKRSVGADNFAPVVVFAESICRGFGRVNGYGATGTQVLVELKVDLRDDIVRIEFLRQFKTVGGLFQFPGALQLDTPEIEV